MSAIIETIVIDDGLVAAQAAISAIYVCSAEPTTFTEATSSFALGYKDFGAGQAFTGPVPATEPIGRKLTSNQIIAGTTLASGTALWWAAVSDTDLYAHGSLDAPTDMTASLPFSLNAFDIRLANQ